jgi:hypothetical protein
MVVYSALMALAWRDTVPDTVPVDPFAGLPCDVILTASTETNTKVYQDPYK